MTNQYKNLKIAWNNFVRRKIPFGIVNTRFLLPNENHSEDSHRQFVAFFFPALPASVWWLVRLFMSMRWRIFYGWYYSYKAINLYGKSVADRFGVSVWNQSVAVLRLTLLHHVPPTAYYIFEFYRSENKKHWWEYVFENELPAYHRWVNRDSAAVEQQRHLLADKSRFSKLMKQMDLPVAKIFLQTNYSMPDISVLLKTQRQLFCKPNSASQGRGAFSLGLDHESRLKLTELGESPCEGDAAWAYLEEQFLKDYYLIQPHYSNHSYLKKYMAGSEAAILRVITMNIATTIRLYCAYLEVPIEKENGKQGFYLPLRVNNGIIESSEDEMKLFAKDGTHYKNLLGTSLPYWKEVLEFSGEAHSQFSAVSAIAWDYIITDDGPVLLEGNANWRTSVPQVFTGGLLKVCAQPEQMASCNVSDA